MTAIDLGAFDEAIARQEAGIPVTILSLDGKTPTGLSIVVAGPDSARAQAAREALHDELVQAQRLTPLSPAELSTQGAKFLAMLTIGWSPKVKVNGEEFDYSEANALKIYERYRFIRQQVDAAAGNRAAFMPASPGSSATPSERQ